MEEDRISELPNEILQHILSSIDIYEPIQTTILSKRWKHLWMSIPGLRLHFRCATALSIVILIQTKDFRSFLLYTDTPFVEECLLYAINHGVQSLRLHTSNNLPLRIPSALFTPTTLRELDLRQKYTRTYLSLPNLKTLYLQTAFIFDDDQGKEWFAGLPELEKLYLREFPMSGLVLRAPKLRVLQIIDSPPRIQEISALLLTSFRYEGDSPLECLEMNLPMLEQVYLDIHGINRTSYIRKWLHLQCVGMFHQLGNATTVSLTSDTLRGLELDGGPIEQSPPFPNVKCLKVMTGRNKVHTVLQSVMKYLTVGTLNFESLMVEFPDGVGLVEHN